MNVNRGKIILVFMALVLGAALGVYQNYQHSFYEVTVHLPAGTKASIYKDLGGDGPFHYDTKSSPLFSLDSTQEISIKRGVYDVVVDNSSGIYTDTVTQFNVRYGTKDVFAKPKYNDAKLNDLLAENQPDIVEALYAKYPLIEQNYSVGKSQLFELGDWCGVVLQSNDPAIDVVRVILHKQDNKWSWAVERPYISIGQPAHPKIPFEVIEATNEL